MSPIDPIVRLTVGELMAQASHSEQAGFFDELFSCMGEAMAHAAVDYHKIACSLEQETAEHITCFAAQIEAVRAKRERARRGRR